MHLCLLEGDYAPPTSLIQHDVTIEGTGAATRLDGMFGCASVSIPANLETTARRAASAVIAVAGAEVTLRGVTLRNCDLGVVVEGGALTLENVEIEAVDLGALALGASTQLVVGATHIAARPLHVDSNATFAGGVGAMEGAGLTVRGGVIENGGGALGVVAFDAPTIVLEDTQLTGGVGGFFLRPGAAPARLGRVTVEGLREVDVGGVVAVAANVVAGAAAEIEDLVVRDVEGYALVASEGAEVGLRGLRAEDVRDIALRARTGATLSVDGAMVARVGIGLGADGGGQMLVSGEVTITAEHSALAAFDAGVVDVVPAASLQITGGGFGGWSDVGGRLSIGAGTIEGTVFALASNGTIEASQVAIRDVQVGLAAWGVLSATDIILERASAVGTVSTGDGIVTLERATITASGPIWLGPGDHTLTDVSMRDAIGPGLIVDEAGAVTMLRGGISDAAGRGIEVRDGGRVSLDGTTLRGNTGAAIALYDGSAEVRRVTFGGTRLDATGRADEIRLVADTTAARDLLVEGNTFLLDVPRECPPGACTLILGDGVNARGIVRPNCLVASAVAGDVNTVVDQDGATLTFEGDSGWSALLAGRASDLGLDTGVVGVLPVVPALPSVGAPPASF